MSISPITSSTAGTNNTISSTTATSSTNTLDKDVFLKLFTTQLRYQDPLNPMDSTAFLTQMAQFTSLEQLYNVNTNLNNLIYNQNSLLQGMSVNLIGKTVTLQDGSSGQVTGISFDGTNTSVVLDNQKTVLLTDIKKIST
jgi:flagellar basal-body rod modification protein FlgD